MSRRRGSRWLVDRVLAAAVQLREAGTAVLLVEQLLEKSLAVADRACALTRGTVALEATAKEPDEPHRLDRVYFGHELDALHTARAM